MKRFIDEYGLTVLSAVTIIILILVISPAGAKIRNFIDYQLNSTTDTAVEHYENTKNESMNIELTQLNNQGQFRLVFITSYKNQTYDVYYRIKRNNEWGKITKYSTYDRPTYSQRNKNKIVASTYIETISVPIYDGEELQIEIRDLTIDNERKFTSEILTYQDQNALDLNNGQYQIFYRNVSASGNNENPEIYYLGEGDFELKNPTKYGKTFLGWYKDANFTVPISTIDTFTGGPITVYAKWDKLDEITFTMPNGGDIIKLNDNKEYIVLSLDLYTAELVEKNSENFVDTISVDLSKVQFAIVSRS